MIKTVAKAISARSARKGTIPTIEERFQEEHEEFKAKFNEIQLDWMTMSFTARNKAARQCLEEIGDMIFFSDEALAVGMSEEGKRMDEIIFQSINLVRTFVVNSTLSEAEVYQLIRKHSQAKTLLHSYVSGEGNYF